MEVEVEVETEIDIIEPVWWRRSHGTTLEKEEEREMS